MKKKELKAVVRAFALRPIAVGDRVSYRSYSDEEDAKGRRRYFVERVKRVTGIRLCEKLGVRISFSNDTDVGYADITNAIYKKGDYAIMRALYTRIERDTRRTSADMRTCKESISNYLAEGFTLGEALSSADREGRPDIIVGISLEPRGVVYYTAHGFMISAANEHNEYDSDDSTYKAMFKYVKRLRKQSKHDF